MDHTSRRIVANTALYTGALVVQKAISFLYFWFLSSRLSPELLGTYVWALSITGLFSVGVDLGLSPILIREAARDKERAEKLLRGVLGLKLLLAVVTLVILGVVMGLSGRDPMTLSVVGVAVLVMLFDSFSMSFWGVMRARQVVLYESVGMVSFHILVFAVGAYLLSIARSPMSAIIALGLGSFSVLVFAVLVTRFRLQLRISPKFDKEIFKFLLHLLPAFAAAGIFVRIYSVADSVLLGYFVDNEAVGLYSVPVKVITALQMLVPAAFVATIYPAMSHYYKNSQPHLARLFERSVGYLAVFIFPLTIALLALVPNIMTMIWPEYLSATPTFLLMTLGIPFMFFAFPTGYLLNACDRQRQNTINRGVITVINIILNILLIPFLGILGAGVAFLVSNIILLILDFWRVRQFLDLARGWLGWVLVKTVIASAGMGAVLFWLRSEVTLFVLVLIGGLVYLVSLLILRAFSREELRLVKELFQRPSV